MKIFIGNNCIDVITVNLLSFISIIICLTWNNVVICNNGIKVNY